jgi:hypothetical protein
MTRLTPLGAVTRGLVAAAVGTACMDLQQYIRYRSGGGTSGFFVWEFSSVHNWEQASVPGQVGKRLTEAWTGKALAPRRAGLTNNVMHWGFGIQWGALFGTVAGSTSISPVLLGLPYGSGVWLFGYAVLPLGHFYRPIWEYDPATRARDWFSHLVYGASTGVAFRVLAGGRDG